MKIYDLTEKKTIFFSEKEEDVLMMKKELEEKFPRREYEIEIDLDKISTGEEHKEIVMKSLIKSCGLLYPFNEDDKEYLKKELEKTLNKVINNIEHGEK